MKKQWYRLDNAALIFPAIIRKNWNNVFRVSATLKEPVDPAALNRAIADLITLDDEPEPTGEDMEIFDPQNIWKHKTVTNYYAKNLRVPIFEKGKLVYDKPDIEEIRTYCLKQVDSLWEEICRFENPQTYYVDLSEKLWEMKQELLREHNR